MSDIELRGDRVLLRPVSAIVQVVGSDFRLRRLGRLSEGFLIFALAVHLLPPIHWTPAKLLMLPVGIFSGAAVFIAAPGEADGKIEKGTVVVGLDGVTPPM